MHRAVAAVRRHPYRTGVLVAGVLALALPVAWYLGSPLFITVSPVEPAPSVAAAAGAVPDRSTPGPVRSTALPGASSPAPRASTPQPTPWIGTERRGEFHGTDDLHFGRGTARLLEVARGEDVVRCEGFAVQSGPDLYVYLSTSADGYIDGAIEVAPLRATEGAFNTAVPPGTDVSRVRSVLIWCKQFSHLFAVAPLH